MSRVAPVLKFEPPAGQIWYRWKGLIELITNSPGRVAPALRLDFEGPDRVRPLDAAKVANLAIRKSSARGAKC